MENQSLMGRFSNRLLPLEMFGETWEEGDLRWRGTIGICVEGIDLFVKCCRLKVMHSIFVHSFIY